MKKTKISVFLIALILIFSGCAIEEEIKKRLNEESTAELSNTQVLEQEQKPMEENNVLVIETSEGTINFTLVKSDLTDYICYNSEIWAGTSFDTVVSDMYAQIPRVSDKLMDLEETGLGCYYGSIGFAVDNGKVTDSIVLVTADRLSGQSESYMNKNIQGINKREEYENSGGVPELEGEVVIIGRVAEGAEVIDKISKSSTNGYVNGYKADDPVKIISVSWQQTIS